MYQIFNSLTGEAMPAIADNPYPLAGIYTARRYEQAKDEDGNLLYLTGRKIGEGIESKPEKTTEGEYVVTVPVIDGLIDTGEAKEVTIQREPYLIDTGMLYEWREVTKSLPELKADKINEIKSMRDSDEAATPIECSGFLFDFDPKARERLSEAFDGATLAVLNGNPLSTVIANWKLYDNTSKDMTIADFFALKQAIITRSQQLHNKANVLKEFINAAESEEELNSIKW